MQQLWMSKLFNVSNCIHFCSLLYRTEALYIMIIYDNCEMIIVLKAIGYSDLMFENIVTLIRNCHDKSK